jgi:hypothetical protein
VHHNPVLLLFFLNHRSPYFICGSILLFSLSSFSSPRSSLYREIEKSRTSN